MASISTGTFIGSAFVPTADRECTPLSPNTCGKNAVKLASSSCSTNEERRGYTVVRTGGARQPSRNGTAKFDLTMTLYLILSSKLPKVSHLSHLSEKIAGAVDHLWLRGKTICAVHEAHQLYDALNSVEVAQILWGKEEEKVGRSLSFKVSTMVYNVLGTRGSPESLS